MSGVAEIMIMRTASEYKENYQFERFEIGSRDNFLVESSLMTRCGHMVGAVQVYH